MPFPNDTDYFPAAKQWMLNFRVAELDKLLSSLRDAGIAVTTNPDWDTPETGRFARIHDPEGNPVELWEPPSERAAHGAGEGTKKEHCAPEQNMYTSRYAGAAWSVRAGVPGFGRRIVG